MKSLFVVRLAAVVALLALAASMPSAVARAQSSSGFESLMDRAYDSFRSAYWYTRTGNLGVAAIEMMTFDQSWKSLREAYEASPPDIYAGDAEWAATLAEIAAINAGALELANNGDRWGAYETIARLQQVFAELRARNGIVGFSDYVNDYDVVIRRLSTYRDWDKALSDSDWQAMTALADDAEGAISALEMNAPETLKANPDFQRTVDNNREALGRYRTHLANRDERGAKGSIRDLRSAYGLLFLKYG